MARPVDSPRPVRLRSIQKLVGEAVMRPLTAGYRIQGTWRDGRAMAEVAETVIRPNDRLSSLERLEIYNRQYWFRIIDCFHDDFPGLRAVLGKARFQRVARAYLAECPSKSFTLRNLGQFLTGFLERHPKLTAPHTKAALDIARLEWAQVKAFDNAAVPPVTLEELQGTPPEKLRLALQPHITLVEARHGVDDYLLEVRKSCAKAGADAIPVIRRRPKREHAFIAVHRHHHSVYYKRLNGAAFYLLSALDAGEPLAQAIATAFEAVPAKGIPSPEMLRGWFQSWTSSGWFCRAGTPGEPA